MKKEQIDSEAFRLALLMTHFCYPKIVNEDTVNPEGLSKVDLNITDENLSNLARYVKEECMEDYLKARSSILEKFGIQAKQS